MLICKFTHDSSLLCGDTRFWVLGPAQRGDNWYDLSLASSGADGAIIGAANLDEGLCHIAMASGSVFQIRSAPDVGFTIQKVKNG